MKVSDVMTRDVLSCIPGDTLERAAQIMWERDCGCVPVVDPSNQLIGILTDRDIAMAAFLSGTTVGKVRVEQTMSKDVRCCHSSDPLEDALATLRKSQLYRLPVIDRGRRIVGMLSLTDALQSRPLLDAKARRRWSEEILNTLIGVTRPRVVREGQSQDESAEKGQRRRALVKS